MKKKSLLFGLFISSCFILSAQTYRYSFNNTFAEDGAVGPTLTEVLDLTCIPTPSAGVYISEVITTAAGICGTATPKTVFAYNESGGVSFPNASLIGGTYTIHLLFKFNAVPAPGDYARIIDFENGGSDDGLYMNDNPCITTGQAITFSGPATCPAFTSNVYSLLTVVRDDATDVVTFYVNGVALGTLTDALNDFVPSTPTTPIIFFRDDITGFPCEDEAGTIKYLSLTAATSTSTEVSNTFTSLCSSTLPLRMIDFSANMQNDNSVLLKWITDNEENTSRFELERSAPGGSFSKISSIATNNVTTRSNYNFVDRQPLSGTNLYRIKIYDSNGEYKYSNILKVSFGGKQIFEVFPNPSKDVITINGIRANEVVKLMNAEGRLLVQKTATGQSITMDISKYPTGIYIVTYFDGEQLQRQKIVKQ
jgi:Secretion system C-terminal sorting domain